jgi:DNA-directed RNA polymerase subunit RPC12/RpoP
MKTILLRCLLFFITCSYLGENMKFPCPNCEKEIFEAKPEFKAMKDFIGVLCPNCGYRIKKEDIFKQTIDESVKMLAERLKSAGLISLL